MTGQRVVSALVALASAAWVVPAWFGIEACLAHFQVGRGPGLDGIPVNSFPHLRFAGDCATLALTWLGVVIAFWSYLGISAFRRRAS